MARLPYRRCGAAPGPRFADDAGQAALVLLDRLAEIDAATAQVEIGGSHYCERAEKHDRPMTGNPDGMDHHAETRDLLTTRRVRIADSARAGSPDRDTPDLIAGWAVLSPTASASASAKEHQ